MEVNSSNLREINHGPAGLEVTFQNGKRYLYPTAGQGEFEALVDEHKNGGSVGKLFHSLVRKVHEGVELSS